MRSILVWMAMIWTSVAAAQAPALDQKRQLAEQKIKLLEMLIGSPAAKASQSSKGADTQPLAERGKRAIESARAALAENRLEEAIQLLDEALKSSSAESRRLQSESALSEVAQRQNYRNLMEQVATYRAAIAELATEPKAGKGARELLSRIDIAMAEAQKDEMQGRLADANRVLGDTYKLAVGEISRLRAGQEVVMSLHFESPADEYAYEQKRFESGEIMVGMMISEGRAAGERQSMVEGFASEGRRLKNEAARLAQGGRHKEAVGLMEQASNQLNRALQAMGVPVF